MTTPSPLTLTPTMSSLAIGPFIAKDRDIVLQMTIPGQPCSKQRPRYVAKGVYTPEKTRKREEDIRAIAKSCLRELALDPTSLFSLRAAFFIETNKKQDVDNMLKLVADALTGIVWLDDRQVVEVFAYKVPPESPGEARTDVVVCRMPGMIAYEMGRCVVCQRPYRTYPSWTYRTCCSRRCWLFTIRRPIDLTCQQCGTPYRAVEHQKSRKFCSVACKVAASQSEAVCAECGRRFQAPKWRIKLRGERIMCSVQCSLVRGRRVQGRIRGTCATCGGRISRRGYKQCMSCYRQTRAKGARGVLVTVTLDAKGREGA